MKRPLIALGLVASTLVVASPAEALTCVPGTSICQGGRIDHVSDAGYDKPIIIFCDYEDAYPMHWDRRWLVYEGQNSTQRCHKDTDIVYVRRDEQIACSIGYGIYVVKWDAQGRHKMNDLVDENCVVQRD